MNTHPLIIDLDGTLLHTDMLHESLLRSVHGNPLHVFSMCYRLTQGKAAFKRHFAHQAQLDVNNLPYNQDLLAWLKTERDNGRKIILCTASDRSIATAIANHLALFDEVIASDGHTNLSGKNKADALVQRFGQNGFDYAGNSSKDIPVWQQARQTILVNASHSLTKHVQQHFQIEKIFPRAALNFTIWRRVLRLHQWLKNILLFIPLLAAHLFTQVNDWLILSCAFFSFGMCASSVYIVNDLLDLESDRQHQRKQKRPFASGQIEIWKGVVIAPLLLLISFLSAFLLNPHFLICLIVYFAITLAYSFGLKRLILVDCLTLAVLYTLRIISGSVAIHLPVSYWLLAFAIFLFLSLAFVKRYAELQLQCLSGKQKIHGRGYHTTDAPLIQIFGVASGYVAVLVLALYVNNEAAAKLYRAAECIWAAVPLILFWVSWMWMQAHRGNMHDDPLVFAVKDKVSLFSGIMFAVLLAIGTVGFAW